MSNIAGQLSIASNDAASPLLITLATNKRFPNAEQSCDEGYTGDAIPAGTVYGDTQEEADAAAAAMLECTPEGFIGETNNTVLSIAVDASDRVYGGGIFTSANGDSAFQFLARWSKFGVLDETFDPNVNSSVNGIRILSGSRILIWGSFTSVAGSTRTRLAIVNFDGTVTSFNPTITSVEPKTACELADGRVFVGFSITGAVVNGVSKGFYVMLNSDGTTDATFAPSISSALNLGIYDCFQRSDNRIQIAGNFDDVDGATRKGLAVLNTDGSHYTTFAPLLQPSGACRVNRVIVASDGNLVIVGTFTIINDGAIDRARNRMAKVSIATGALIASGTFTDPGLDAECNDVVEVGSGQFIASGSFANVGNSGFGAITRDQLARIGSDGNPDAAWPDMATSPNNVVPVAKFADNQIICGLAAPHAIGGESKNGLCRITTAGVVVT